MNCAVANIVWTDPGKLLSGARPSTTRGYTCLKAEGVHTVIDQRLPSAVPTGEPALAQQAGLEYINLGIADDRAPSPRELQARIDTVKARVALGQVVLVFDSGGRGRVGLWDAGYLITIHR